MVKDQFNERPRKSYCEKIHKATFGRFHLSSRYLKNNDASSPSLATTYYPAAHGHRQVIKTNKFVLFSSNIVENNEEVDGQKSFNDEKYTSYIAGMKTKMRAPSDVCGGTAFAYLFYGLSDRVIELGLRDFMLSVLGESMQCHRLLLYRGRNRRAGVPRISFNDKVSSIIGHTTLKLMGTPGMVTG
ncbi:hypothetical protein Tco_1051788 [Tanacetum coccineum]